MKTQSLAVFVALFAFVILSYTSAKAQEDSTDKKETASAPKTITKPTVVVTDNLQIAADKTRATAVVPPAKETKTFGNNAVEVTAGAVGQAQVDGKWHTVTTWDGSRWVPKRVFYPNKKP